jgi:lipoic acid synthetase
MNPTPQWLKKRLSVNEAFFETKKVLSDLSINTVCESARCPNLNECFSRRFATFMILGKNCTRSCAYCSAGGKDELGLPDAGEGASIADCANRLSLKYVIVTSVTRDDLSDGGASQFVKVVESLRRELQDITIELLIPDFAGNRLAIRTVVSCGADMIGHNIETVKRLYAVVRKAADYSRSLEVLKFIKEVDPQMPTKSAILVGMGETDEEVIGTMEDLRKADCDILTIGQYLRPSKENHPVQRFVTPEEFARYKSIGIDMGFGSVSSGPFVRSSYLAEESFPAVSYKL